MMKLSICALLIFPALGAGATEAATARPHQQVWFIYPAPVPVCPGGVCGEDYFYASPYGPQRSGVAPTQNSNSAGRVIVFPAPQSAPTGGVRD